MIPKFNNPFIDSVAEDAVLSQRATGVPASVTLAQAILESGWGKSGLSSKYHNYFGIKGKGPAGTAVLSTGEHFNGKDVVIKDGFRVYHSAAESFEDHGRFFVENKRYAEAMRNAHDAERFAKEIHKAGYATDPNYSQKLIGLIRKYRLTRLDDYARGQGPLSSGSTHVSTSGSASGAGAAVSAAGATKPGSYVVRSGDTLFSIAKRFHTTVDDIARVNGIRDVNRLSVGQKLILPGGSSSTPSTSNTSQASTTNTSTSGGKPKWLEIAQGELGQKEIAGSQHNARIIAYHAATSLKATSDEVPWCSSFVNWCMAKAGVKGTGSASAASWASWGTKSEARLGAVAVIYNAAAANSSLSSSGNHVGFLLEENDTHYVLLGGNQSDQVKVSSFPKSKWKLKAYRWSASAPMATSTPAPAVKKPAIIASKPTKKISEQPKWLAVAQGELGQKEIAGSQHNSRIIAYHAATSLKATSDEVPWCSSFVNWCMAKAGVKGTGSASAASWASWGTKSEARLGAVAVIYNAAAANSSLSSSGNHVGFLLEENDTHYVLLGGNQGDQVKVSSFPKSKWKLKAYRWSATSGTSSVS